MEFSAITSTGYEENNANSIFTETYAAYADIIATAKKVMTKAVPLTVSR